MEDVEQLITFNGEELTIQLQKYAIGNQTRINLIDKEGMPYMTATVAVEHIELGENEVIIKDYSENSGILKALKEANIISNVTERVKQGFVTLYICDLLL